MFGTGRRARHATFFFVHPHQSGMPFMKNTIDVLLDLGCTVELLAPSLPELDATWDTRVARDTVTYNFTWLRKNLWRRRWSRSTVFVGTSRLGLAFSGLLGALHRRPHVSLCDELFTGNYYGNDPAHWVRLTNWAHRRAAFTLLPDKCREWILRDMAAVSSDHAVYQFPCCTRGAADFSGRDAVRSRWAVPSDAFVVLHSGWINDQQGCQWMVDALPHLEPGTFLVLHTGGSVEGTVRSLCTLASRELPLRHDFGERVPWRALDGRMAAADIGLVLYFHTGPQFQNMGVCSQKLCLFLRSGVPVVVSRQPSFEFLEKYGCGILVSSPQEMLDAIAHIRANHAAYRANALRCYREYVDVDLYRPAVVEAFRRLLPGARTDEVSTA